MIYGGYNAISKTLTPGCIILHIYPCLGWCIGKQLRKGQNMVNVFSNDPGTEDESFVDLLPFLECSTWNHQELLTSEECL